MQIGVICGLLTGTCVNLISLLFIALTVVRSAIRCGLIRFSWELPGTVWGTTYNSAPSSDSFS